VDKERLLIRIPEMFFALFKKSYFINFMQPKKYNRLKVLISQVFQRMLILNALAAVSIFIFYPAVKQCLFISV
jgi:hypothetical protein